MLLKVLRIIVFSFWGLSYDVFYFLFNVVLSKEKLKVEIISMKAYHLSLICAQPALCANVRILALYVGD